MQFSKNLKNVWLTKYILSERFPRNFGTCLSISDTVIRGPPLHV